MIFEVQASHQMPVPTVGFVELYCDVPPYVLFIPMGFNILLTFICVFYGFGTRKLPENFNESWFIFISVCATLMLWFLLLPSYFLAFYAHQKAVILAFSLALIAFTNLLLLFGPKLYALYFVAEENIKMSTIAGGVSTVNAAT
jgi:hypothetical protein